MNTLESTINWWESLQEKKRRYKENYNLVRGIIQFGWSYHFLTSKDPYFQHLVIDHNNNQYVVSGDNTVSSIDIKTTERFQANRNFWKNLNFIKEATTEWINTVRWIIRNAIRNKNRDNNTIAPEIKIDSKYWLQHRKILTKLYIDTLQNEYDLRDQHIETNEIRLNTQWEQYYSDILSSFYIACDKKKFFWSTREDTLFPNGIFSIIRNKLKSQKTLSSEEICDFIIYILSKEKAPEWESQEAQQERHKANGMKINAGNQLRAMLFDEQKYNYFTMKKLTQKFWSTQHKISDIISQELDIPQGDIYTEWRSKDLFSMGSKELRRDIIQDWLWSRTWIDDTHLLNAKRDDVIVWIFKKQIEEFKAMYKKQWYTILIDDIEIANKFKKWEIIIEDTNVTDMQQELHNFFWVQRNQWIKDKKWEVYKYKIDKEHISNLPWNVIDGIQKTIKNDKKKTGGNGPYADIKFRMSYRLQNDSTGDIIENTGWYEHQIVNMNSHNEGGLSSHFLVDAKKTVVNLIRSRSTIGLNEFSEVVSGWLNTLTEELWILWWYIDSYQRTGKRDDERPPRKFVEEQFKIRNQVPQELLKIAWINNQELTYIEIDRNSLLKWKIEKAIERYLLDDLFENNMVNWFFYDNDTIGDISEMIKQWTENNLYSNWLKHNYIINKWLTDPLNNKYGLCWGWSNNLCNGLRNWTYSSKGYIGIKNQDGVDFFKVTDLAGILADCTYLQPQKDVTIEKGKIELFQILKTQIIKEKTSS